MLRTSTRLRQQQKFISTTSSADNVGNDDNDDGDNDFFCFNYV